ncbi:hypothetical protein LSCM1_07652 [Leishmania martiniquensis]|uniref:Uncharacterized protein n=1 Tax=Leishmania martiniquensis TaxID=1580590 RepID=A0A836HZZ9_9TRYP|nr:hypothetical protein LSCM1_07652 [Leishmania martiniquensis]
MVRASPARPDSVAAVSDAAALPSSPEGIPTLGHCLTPQQVAQWTLQDVGRHIFFIVWVCGIPVHLQYILHVLEHSAASAGRRSEQTSHGRPTRESLIAVAQAGVFEPVCRRAAELRHALSRWPTTATLPTPGGRQSSELVALGVLSEAPEHEGSGVRSADCGECDGDGGNVKATASSTLYSSSCTIRAGAVTPAERFANVEALALCSPVEREGRSRFSAPSATWCAQAYWTALDQAQQWIARWPLLPNGSVRVTDSPGGTGAMGTSAWLQLQPACALTVARRKRLRGCGTPVTDDVVVVDADEEKVQNSAGGAGATSDTADGAVHHAKSPRREAAEVVVVDSDDDYL